jgi:hypothetical protein
MPLNRFYTHNTIYVDGVKFQGGQWTEAWETPGLASRVQSGIMRPAKPIDQVENHVAPPLVTLQATPQLPIEKPQVSAVPVVTNNVHPALAPKTVTLEDVPVEDAVIAEEPVVEEVQEAEVEVLPVVEAVDTKSPIKRKSSKG